MKIIHVCLSFLLSYATAYANAIPYQDIGVTYNGLHKSTTPSQNDIIEDLSSINKAGFSAVRSYYPQFSGTVALMPLMKQKNMNLLIGLFIFPNNSGTVSSKAQPPICDEEIASKEKENWVCNNYIDYIKPYLNDANLTGVLIGNENFADKESINNAIKGYLKQVKIDNPTTPVSTAQTHNFWLNDNRAEEVAKLCDFIAVNIYPEWNWQKPDAQNQPIGSNGQSLSVQSGLDSFVKQYQQIKEKYKPKQVVVTEVGWPTTYGWVVNVPQQPKQYQVGINNAQSFYQQVNDWAKANGVIVYYYSMFDNWYGVDTSSQYNFHFGRLDTNRATKGAN